MDELAFLTLILLINHRIPHVLVEFYECRFLAKNKGQSCPLIQGTKCHPITRRHAGMTWIGGPTRASNRHDKDPGTWKCSRKLRRRSQNEGGNQGQGLLVYQPHWWAGHGSPPPTFSLWGKLPSDFLRSVPCATCQVSALEVLVSLLYKYERVRS